MRLIIHIGLNKAASTWLQHSLAANPVESVYYDNVDNYFMNHNCLYKLIKDGKKEAVLDWITRYVLKARENKATCAIISAEDIWQELPFNRGATDAILQAMTELDKVEDIKTRILIIKRDFKKWAFSYCIQILKNEGALTPKRLADLFCSSINISQFPPLAASRFPVNSVDIVTCDSKAFLSQLQTIIHPSFKGLAENKNISRKGNLAVEILAANLRGIYSFSQGIHPNSPSLDSNIDNHLEVWDNLLETPGSEKLRKALAMYDAQYTEVLTAKIEECARNMGSEEKVFWSLST
jgi:hypothetical protein